MRLRASRLARGAAASAAILVTSAALAFGCTTDAPAYQPRPTHRRLPSPRRPPPRRPRTAPTEPSRRPRRPQLVADGGTAAADRYRDSNSEADGAVTRPTPTATATRIDEGTTQPTRYRRLQLRSRRSGCPADWSKTHGSWPGRRVVTGIGVSAPEP